MRWAQCVVCWERGGTPLFIQEPRRCFVYSWRETLGCTALAWWHATARAKCGWAVPVGGRLPLGVSHPLTMATLHRLHMVGHGLYMDAYSMVFCPVCTKLMGFLFLCANQHWKAPFGELFHVFVFVTYKITFSKYMWNLVSSKCLWSRLLISALFVS